MLGKNLAAAIRLLILYRAQPTEGAELLVYTIRKKRLNHFIRQLLCFDKEKICFNLKSTLKRSSLYKRGECRTFLLGASGQSGQIAENKSEPEFLIYLKVTAVKIALGKVDFCYMELLNYPHYINSCSSLQVTHMFFSYMTRQ